MTHSSRTTRRRQTGGSVHVAPTTSARILIVDDDAENRRLLSTILARGGYARVQTCGDPEGVATTLADFDADLVVLDLHMPQVDGFRVLETLAPTLRARGYLPVLVLTGDSSGEAKRRALSLGAKDFVEKPFDHSELLLRIRNLLETRFLYRLLQDHNATLEAKVQARTEELEAAQMETLERLASAAEFRDDDTGRHTQRVGALSALLAEALDLPPHRVTLVRRAAPLHDIGKIGIPDAVLLKPGRLTAEERATMQTHTTIGAAILAGGRSELIVLAECIALRHHERWDGGGYPGGLAGTTIPLEARIVAAADFLDALAHDRPYRAALPLEKVLSLIAEERGRHFDPDVVDALGSAHVRDRLPSLLDARTAS